MRVEGSKLQLGAVVHADPESHTLLVAIAVSSRHVPGNPISRADTQCASILKVNNHILVHI